MGAGRAVWLVFLAGCASGTSVGGAGADTGAGPWPVDGAPHGGTDGVFAGADGGPTGRGADGLSGPDAGPQDGGLPRWGGPDGAPGGEDGAPGGLDGGGGPGSPDGTGGSDAPDAASGWDTVGGGDAAATGDAPGGADTCGDAGCGGSCGACPAGHGCVGGACVCQPSCAGKQCGDDGCGGSCGACGDGDACNGVETCVAGACVTPAPASCPVAPPECITSGTAPGPTSGVLTAISAAGFRLVDEGGWSAAAQTLDAIAAHPSATPVGLGDVLADLNRTATKVTSVPGVECFHAGFTWEPGDVGVTYWWPQGISGTATAYPDGAYQGRKVALVSWYHKPEEDAAGSPDKGVRVAIVDTTSLSDLHYRLALLVAPTTAGGKPTFGAVKVHAGGIAWYRDHLYVADTSNGFRVFDLTRILKVQTGDKNAIGLVSDAAGYHAAGYKYVIPQVSRYKLCGGSCCARFSFVALDPTTSPPSLLAGEYTASELTGRLHRWPLDPSTGRMLETAGVVQATEAFFPGVAKMQGADAHAGAYFVATSNGSGNGTLHVGSPGKSLKKRGWAVGPEDLHWSSFSDNLWTVSEYPGKRWVFAVKGASISAGCP